MPNSSGGMGKPMPNRTPLREWQDKHEQELEEITAKEQASKQATRATAAEELGKWYEERKDTISKKASSNRKEEVAAEEARQAALKPGANAWERVVDLIDTNAKTLDDARDTSRMRALLIQLKSNPVVSAA